MMPLTRLGNSGLMVSRLCLGTMTFGGQVNEDEASTIMDAALAGGINFFDTADVYPLGATADTRGQTERIIGGWLKRRRDEVVLATKCGSPMGSRPWQGGTSRKHILHAIDASLERLGTDYVDLYQLHRDDEETPLDETLEALDIVVRSGRARYIGVSNWMAWRITRMIGRAEAKRFIAPLTVQPRYNLLFREFERDLFPMCQSESLATLCYNPLAGGLLTGKHRDPEAPAPESRFGDGRAAKMYRARYWQERQLEAVSQIVAVADEAGLSPATMAIAWVLARPGVTCAIVGATRAAQLPDALAASEMTLDDALIARLDAITDEFRYGDATR